MEATAAPVVPARCRCGVFVDGHVQMKEIDTPRLDGTPAGTVLIRGIYTTICGSDMLYIHKPRDIDSCDGASIHEVVGELVAVNGASLDATEFALGDIVLAMPSNYMESGIYRQVHEDLKAKLRRIPLTGGLCEYFYSHISHIFKIPDPHSQVVPLHHYTAAQPLGTLLWMVRKVPNLLFKDVVVYGAGQNGCLLVHVLSNMGARRVIAVDLVQERLDAAKEMRATHTILGGNHDEVVRRVREITDGGADFVFEMVGHQQETLSDCTRIVRDGGAIVAFGVPSDDTYTDFPFPTLFRRNITLMTSVFPLADEDFGFAVEMIAQRRVNVGPLFRSSWYSLADSNAAFVDTMTKKHQVLKVIIDLTK
ncbi:hypothetical protein PTSG_01606 [Salpingoeca rosetta]|uniref:Enoyl reductase (ER) domain-containing protein n=1 Tax=Salpingoeca rosetta (strain ATCC 50818 / BSB-021) TaxID=946362 RepID=F2TYF4_SALR5|nr:uncharacterized protein PTSG_01606 [Salpingoeca rosetta]EGD78628.1 hypothetical protein PTSG_01606 [Salpingoeca rosetta]|eukprot:XP_004997586.1 hypothetical protein PTSG_01606 [Salpingoeca rosetta]